MIRAGMSVDLICLKGESESLRETVNGVNVLRLPIPKTRGGKVAYLVQYSAFVVACFILLAFRSVRKSHAVVHAHNMPDFLVFSALIPRILGSKVMLDLHDPMPELIQSIYGVPSNHWLVNLLIRLERWSIGFADLVITPNTTFRDLFEARGCPAGKILIVMNSPQIELFDPRRFEPKPSAFGKARSFQLMYHGLLVERHGLETAIRAVAMLRDDIPGLQFHIYGDKTPYMVRMTELVTTLGLGKIVLYHGCKSHHEIAKALAAIDLGIIPNRRSPFTEINMPTRIFENLAMGKTVVVPNTTGIRDYFSKDQLVFFEPDNVESLAQAIRWAYLHPQEVEQMVLRGQEVLDAHTWQRERTGFLKGVRDLIDGGQEQLPTLVRPNS